MDEKSRKAINDKVDKFINMPEAELRKKLLQLLIEKAVTRAILHAWTDIVACDKGSFVCTLWTEVLRSARDQFAKTLIEVDDGQE